MRASTGGSGGSCGPPSGRKVSGIAQHGPADIRIVSTARPVVQVLCRLFFADRVAQARMSMLRVRLEKGSGGCTDAGKAFPGRMAKKKEKPCRDRRVIPVHGRGPRVVEARTRASALIIRPVSSGPVHDEVHVFASQETIIALADRLEQAYLRRYPDWSPARTSHGVWTAAAAGLSMLHRNVPSVPVDPELFVAVQPGADLGRPLGRSRGRFGTSARIAATSSGSSLNFATRSATRSVRPSGGSGVDRRWRPCWPIPAAGSRPWAAMFSPAEPARMSWPSGSVPRRSGSTVPAPSTSRRAARSSRPRLSPASSVGPAPRPRHPGRRRAALLQHELKPRPDDASPGPRTNSDAPGPGRRPRVSPQNPRPCCRSPDCNGTVRSRDPPRDTRHTEDKDPCEHAGSAPASISVRASTC